MTALKITKSSGNIFEDLGFEPQEAQNLQLRSQTMITLTKWFEASGLTQAMAAKTLGITQPRLNQLIKGKIEVFSLDALVNMAANAGMHVGLTIKGPTDKQRAILKINPPLRPLRLTTPTKQSKTSAARALVI